MSSLRVMVAELVQERGGATVDDLMPELTHHGYDRRQVMKALHNAKDRGWLRCDGKPSRLGCKRHGSAPAMYYPGAKMPPKETHALVPSVFDLGSPKAYGPMVKGRVHSPLGSWLD